MNLAERYRTFLLDLDGVVYRGDEPIPGAAPAVEGLRRHGPVVFLTNNSSRTPAQVAEKLGDLGVRAGPEEVLTSAMALARLVAEDGTGPRTAFAIGEDGVRQALSEAGVDVLSGEPERADLVVVGWDRSVDYGKLRRASLLVERGARLLATNDDPSYPAPDGLWPGAGAILAAITTTTGAVPSVVGKPHRGLFEVAAEMAGPGPILVVGDRLETDVAGADGMGWDSALVLTGATTPGTLAGGARLPTYLLRSVGGLLEPAARVRLGEEAGTVVAVDPDGGVVGTARFEAMAEDAVLSSVVVAPPWRGRAVGTHLVARAVHAARRAGYRSLSLLAPDTEGFFARVGFRPVSREELPAAIAASPGVARGPGSSTAMTLELGGRSSP